MEPRREGHQRPDIDTRLDTDDGPDADKGPDINTSQGRIDTRLDTDNVPDADKGPDINTSPGRIERGQLNTENHATASFLTTDEPRTTSKLLSNDPNLSVDEIQPRKK